MLDYIRAAAFRRLGAIKVMGWPYIPYFFSPIIPINMNKPLQQTQMFSTYQSIIALLCKQMQTLPAPPAEQSDYELWAHRFMKTVVCCPLI